MGELGRGMGTGCVARMLLMLDINHHLQWHCSAIAAAGCTMQLTLKSCPALNWTVCHPSSPCIPPPTPPASLQQHPH